MYQLLRALFGKSIDKFLIELTPMNARWIRNQLIHGRE